MARKAATISRPQALAAWLHGVARHLALKCRRRQREARCVEGSPAPPLDELTARDVLLTRDEAL